MNKRDANRLVMYLRSIAQARGNINVDIDMLDTDSHGAVVRIHNRITDEITERWGNLTHDRYKAMLYEVRNIVW